MELSEWETEAKLPLALYHLKGDVQVHILSPSSGVACRGGINAPKSRLPSGPSLSQGVVHPNILSRPALPVYIIPNKYPFVN
jgi:hypothetical protein